MIAESMRIDSLKLLENWHLSTSRQETSILGRLTVTDMHGPAMLFRQHLVRLAEPKLESISGDSEKSEMIVSCRSTFVRPFEDIVVNPWKVQDWVFKPPLQSVWVLITSLSPFLLDTWQSDRNKSESRINSNRAP